MQQKTKKNEQRKEEEDEVEGATSESDGALSLAPSPIGAKSALASIACESRFDCFSALIHTEPNTHQDSYLSLSHTHKLSLSPSLSLSHTHTHTHTHTDTETDTRTHAHTRTHTHIMVVNLKTGHVRDRQYRGTSLIRNSPPS